MIKVNNLKFSYPEDDFSLNIPDLYILEHHAVALTGPSGSGKSTLMKILAAELPIENGSVQLFDQQINQLTDSQRRALRLSGVGMILQDSALLDYLSLKDNICLPAKLLGLKIDQQRLTSLTESCGISSIINKKPAQISEGEKQRVAICRALLVKPRIILADEPTSSLDPKNSLAVTELLVDQCKANDATLVMITHDINQLEMFDRTIDLASLNGDAHA
ncbi:MAG: ATP-binding cassette domain-containing protein [Lentisphaerales bacterium]|nr:ATP-binding cassette domain-containing protein [Lentisphaerales bacterium]